VRGHHGESDEKSSRKEPAQAAVSETSVGDATPERVYDYASSSSNATTTNNNATTTNSSSSNHNSPLGEEGEDGECQAAHTPPRSAPSTPPQQSSPSDAAEAFVAAMGTGAGLVCADGEESKDTVTRDASDLVSDRVSERGDIQSDGDVESTEQVELRVHRVNGAAHGPAHVSFRRSQYRQPNGGARRSTYQPIHPGA
jgi:hypothetical protein